MFTVKEAGAVVATVSELKARTKETIGAAQAGPVYLLRDGQPVAGLISMEMMAVLTEALEDRRMARIAEARVDAVRSGDDVLVDESTFWREVDARAERGAPPRPLRKRSAR